MLYDVHVSFLSVIRYLSCKVVTDTCCPQGSSIPPGVDVSIQHVVQDSSFYMYMYIQVSLAIYVCLSR